MTKMKDEPNKDKYSPEVEKLISDIGDLVKDSMDSLSDEPDGMSFIVRQLFLEQMRFIEKEVKKIRLSEILGLINEEESQELRGICLAGMYPLMMKMDIDIEVVDKMAEDLMNIDAKDRETKRTSTIHKSQQTPKGGDK